MYRNGDWRGRIATAERAASVIRSGHRVYVHNGCAEPLELVKALTQRGAASNCATWRWSTR